MFSTDPSSVFKVLMISLAVTSGERPFTSSRNFLEVAAIFYLKQATLKFGNGDWVCVLVGSNDYKGSKREVEQVPVLRGSYPKPGKSFLVVGFKIFSGAYENFDLFVD